LAPSFQVKPPSAEEARVRAKAGASHRQLLTPSDASQEVVTPPPYLRIEPVIVFDFATYTEIRAAFRFPFFHFLESSRFSVSQNQKKRTWEGGHVRLCHENGRRVASVQADADRFAKNVAPIIREIQSTGVASHRGIARSLNARGVTTARGGVWTAVQVSSILRRV
jgi:hypothetical protein